MRPDRLSEMLTTEGYSVPKSTCEVILEKINKADPNVDGVFHKNIQKQLYDSRILRTPLGRERQFFGLRQNDKNYSILNEAYSFIPQSTVGDNTGLAVLYLDSSNNYILQDGHDSIVQELPCTLQELLTVFKDTKKAFERTIRFDNGIEVDIPIEGHIGTNWFDKIEISPWSEEGIEIAFNKLKLLEEQKADEKAVVCSA
jgi:hypothetical protein